MTVIYSHIDAIEATMTNMTAELLLGIRTNGSGEMIRKGLPYKSLLRFRENVGASSQEVSLLLGVPVRTILRRKEAGRLTMGESNNLYRAARVFAAVVAYHEGDEEAARQWMRDTVPALGRRRPIDLLDNDADAQLVVDTLARLDEGTIT